ncbi:MAG: hypothetical protein GY696_36750 [Gammaproteobacteria bacterium]|nr:hypothetical protein [Gammaproteobacteria bacterium]
MNSTKHPNLMRLAIAVTCWDDDAPPGGWPRGDYIGVFGPVVIPFRNVTPHFDMNLQFTEVNLLDRGTENNVASMLIAWRVFCLTAKCRQRTSGHVTHEPPPQLDSTSAFLREMTAFINKRDCSNLELRLSGVITAARDACPNLSPFRRASDKSVADFESEFQRLLHSDDANACEDIELKVGGMFTASRRRCPTSGIFRCVYEAVAS